MTAKENFIKDVEALPADDNEALLELVSKHQLSMGEFAELDERPGLYDEKYRDHNWHRRLRIVRNDRDNNLFDRLR